MILDSIKSFEKYQNLAEGFDKVYKFICSKEFSPENEGRHEIDGKRVYCTIGRERLRDVTKAPLEIHDSYIDIHALFSGTETIGFKDRSLCSLEEVKYDEASDIAFLKEEEMPDNYLSLGEGNLAIVFPSDAHAPLIGEGEIVKAVFKVRIENNLEELAEKWKE